MINEDMKITLNLYVKEHIHTGSFLRAVLENDLFEAMARADDINRYQIFEICQYIYNNIPTICYGCPEKVKNWLSCIKVTQADIGKWVEYTNVGVKDRGRIKSFNDKFVFVVFHCDDKWNDYRNYTGEACKREHLKYI